MNKKTTLLILLFLSINLNEAYSLKEKETKNNEENGSSMESGIRSWKKIPDASFGVDSKIVKRDDKRRMSLKQNRIVPKEKMLAERRKCLMWGCNNLYDVNICQRYCTI